MKARDLLKSAVEQQLAKYKYVGLTDKQHKYLIYLVSQEPELGLKGRFWKDKCENYGVICAILPDGQWINHKDIEFSKLTKTEQLHINLVRIREPMKWMRKFLKTDIVCEFLCPIDYDNGFIADFIKPFYLLSDKEMERFNNLIDNIGDGKKPLDEIMKSINNALKK